MAVKKWTFPLFKGSNMADDEGNLPNEAAVEGLAGAGGAIVALLTTYPLLTINTRQQTAAGSRKKGDGDRAQGVESGEAKEPRAKSTLEEAREILTTSGVAGLYAGIKPAFVGTVCSNVVYFYLCGYLREAWLARRNAVLGKAARKRRHLNAIESLTIASLAGCGNVLATNPIWILVTRMQANRKRKESAEGNGQTREVTLTETATKLYEESGVLGFWKGVAASLIMVSNPSIQYMFFEALGNMRNDRLGGQASAMSAFDVFCHSALAKLGATVITYPMLVVKSNMQNFSRANVSGGSASAKGGGIAETIHAIFDKQGPTGFYKGMRTKIFQSVFAASLLYMCKEEIKKGARAVVGQKK